MLSTKKKICLGIAFLSYLCLSGFAHAEWRSYKIKKPVAAVLENFLEEMRTQKVRFSIKKVFEQKREGKQGFVLELFPRGTLCELAFYPQLRLEQTLVRVFTQDHKDAQFFHILMVKALKMREIGLSPPKTTHSAKNTNSIWQTKMRLGMGKKN